MLRLVVIAKDILKWIRTRTPHLAKTKIQEHNDQHPKEVEEKWFHLRQTVLEAIPSRKNPQHCMGRLRYSKTTHPLGL